MLITLFLSFHVVLQVHVQAERSGEQQQEHDDDCDRQEADHGVHCSKDTK